MRRKVIIDSCVYIDFFNKNLYSEILNPFQNSTYLAYPVLHELWMGLNSRVEVRLLTRWRDRYIDLKRFIVPTVATLALIGDACLQLRRSGKLNPAQPKYYNDVCISALAHQIGAVVLSKNRKDFELIKKVIDFECDGID